jgi:predicted TIM-barrel fold metal-dependent hydrolase
MRVVGEVEFVNGIAAMSASGQYGPCRVAAGIVSKADLIQGARVEPVLEALVRAGNGRLRGVRDVISWEDHGVYPIRPDRKGVMDNPAFREGLSRLKPLGLAFEGQTFHMQVLDFARMADAFPDTTFILEHLSTPLGIKFYEGKHAEIFAQWRPDMKELGKRHNVAVQLGGLGMAGFGSPFFGRRPPAGAEELVAEWRPWIETAIEACGPDKCMFESNFPTERPTCDYRTKWNVFKTIAAQYAPAEKASLFHDTAQRVYRLTE